MRDTATPARAHRKKRFIAILAFGVGLLPAGMVSVASPAGADTSPASAGAPQVSVPGAAGTPGDSTGLVAALQTVLARQFAASPSAPGIAARVDAPGLRWAGAVGSPDRTRAGVLTPDHSFRIASVTKTFTAAAVLALVDRGRVDLDAPISRYLPRPYPHLLRQGKYSPERISVRQLLNHTSGLYDYVDAEYQDQALSDLTRRWTPMEQIAWAMTHGSPQSAPGQEFHYSDTGYVLLARIVEKATGLPQARAYQRLLRLDRLGLTSTWFETLEPAPVTAGPRSHQYFVDPGAGLDIDTYHADPSFDLYGGGGLVSTVADLTTFYRALFEGRVISRSALRTMLTTAPTGEPSLRAGMGIFRTSIEGSACWWHSGFWGSVALYCPEHKLAVSANTNAATTDRSAPTELDDAIALATTVITHRPCGPRCS